jgi:hypothetical protein
MREQCAFCPEIAVLTGEHIWSRWIGDLLDVDKFLITQKLPDGRVRQYHKKKLDLKAKVVCSGCNSGWMSDLENSTKPFLEGMILHGTDSNLSSKEIVLLAAVAFKNAVVADQMQENSPRFFSFLSRQRFAKTLRIPDGVQMWLAALGKQKGLFVSGDLKSDHGKGAFEINNFTYAMGHVAIQVNSPRWKHKSNRRNFAPPRLTQHVYWDTASLPFWPIADGRSIVWPPPKLIGQDTLDDFVNRWRRLDHLP